MAVELMLSVGPISTADTLDLKSIVLAERLLTMMYIKSKLLALVSKNSEVES
jgi:hypothetical protein